MRLHHPFVHKTPSEPGDTGLVTVVFNPTGRPGRFSKTVTMDIAGAGAGPRQSLVIKGVVIGSSNTLRSRYPIEAGAMKLRTTAVPFGTVMKGKAKSAFVEVYNSSSSPIVPRWENTPAYMRVAASSDTIPPGEQAVYLPGARHPQKPPSYGILTDSLTLTDGNSHAKIDITAILEEDFSQLTPGQRQKAPQISISDSRVDFGQFPADSAPITRSFAIDNTGKSDLILAPCLHNRPRSDTRAIGNENQKREISNRKSHCRPITAPRSVAKCPHTGHCQRPGKPHYYHPRRRCACRVNAPRHGKRPA